MGYVQRIYDRILMGYEWNLPWDVNLLTSDGILDRVSTRILMGYEWNLLGYYCEWDIDLGSWIPLTRSFIIPTLPEGESRLQGFPVNGMVSGIFMEFHGIWLDWDLPSGHLEHSYYWTWPCRVGFPRKNGDLPWLCSCLPEGRAFSRVRTAVFWENLGFPDFSCSIFNKSILKKWLAWILY